ncbi:MAG TPA: helix-turn-helix transcriptional regulator [Steroidobacteraceae bacterium]
MNGVQRLGTEVNASALSALLLELYRYSRELTLTEFHGRALLRLRSDLAFDSAWWGVAHSSHDIHGSYPYGLPTGYPSFYLDHVKSTDTLAEAAQARHGESARFGPADFARSPGLSLLTQEFGIQQALCCVVGIPKLDLLMFISLYRHERQPTYTEEERQFCNWVAPHLWATWSASWIAHMEHIRANHGPSRVAHAICDQRGILHNAEPRFVKLLQLEWPDWRGPVLPRALRSDQRTMSDYQGRNIALRCFNACGFTLLEAKMVSALDVLSPRERTIAAAFGEGQSYKQIAAQLGLSPATVRHHLRSIYSKANISNKGALAGLLSQSHP